MLINGPDIIFTVGVALCIISVVVIFIYMQSNDSSDDIDELHREICRIDTEIDEHIRHVENRIDEVEAKITKR